MGSTQGGGNEAHNHNFKLNDYNLSNTFPMDGSESLSTGLCLDGTSATSTSAGSRVRFGIDKEITASASIGWGSGTDASDTLLIMNSGGNQTTMANYGAKVYIKY